MLAVKTNAKPIPLSASAQAAAAHANKISDEAKAKREAELKPTTVVKGKTVQVVGTKGGAISHAQTVAKANKIKSKGTTPAKAGHYGAAQTVRVVDAEEGNPHRQGTYRYKAFDALTKCKTVAEYVRTGYKTKYLNRWVKMGLIRIL